MADQNPPDSSDKAKTLAPRSVGDEIDLFVKQIDGLADTLPLALKAIQGAHDASREHLAKFLTEECHPVDNNGRVTYTMESGKYLQFRRLNGRAQKTILARQLVPRSILVSLVSQFDAYLGRLIRQLFKMKPEILNSSASTLTFAQLAEYQSIEDAREYVIDKEIESVLRKSHSEQFDWLENKFGIPLRQDLACWPVFIEITERRNLFVHTSGVISHQYLEVASRNKCVVDADISRGKTLSATREYVSTAHECLFELGVKLGQVMWRKLKPEDMHLADASLIRVPYELLGEGRFKLARVLLDFATGTLKKYGSEDSRLTLIVNRAQAYKWSKDEEKARAIVNSVDWTATSLKFRLAQAVLLDDFKTAIELMKKVGANGEIDRESYREWPLFQEIRKTLEFAEAFHVIFGVPINRITLDTSASATAVPSKEIIN